MGTRASVLSVNKDGTLQLQAGILKITAKQDEVRVVEGETQSQKEARQHRPAGRAHPARRRGPPRDGPAGHDDRRGHRGAGPLPGHRHDGQAGER